MLNCASIYFAAILALSATSLPPRASSLPVLSVHNSISSRLLPGQSRLFRVKAAGAFRVGLDQKNADFALEALDARERLVRTVDAFGWGPETASFTDESGVSFVRVRRTDTEKFSASFTLSLVAVSAGAEENLHARAEDAGTKARALTRDHGEANLRDSVAAAREAAALWKQSGDPDAYVRASLALADALNSSVGAFEEARGIYGAVLAQSRELGDVRSEAECLNNRGVLFRRQASYQEALDDFRPALDLWRRLPVQTGFAATLNNLALLETDLGDYQNALGHYAEARALLVRLGNDTGRAFVDSNLGLIHGRLGDARASIQAFQSAAAVFESHGNGLAAGRALTNSARMYLRSGDPARAESNVRRGMALIAPVHDDRATAEADNLLGEVFAARKRFADAANCFRTALEIARKSGDRVAQANALMNLGLASIAVSQRTEGIGYLEESRQLFAKIGTPASEATVLYSLALAWRDAGDLERAREMAAAAVTIVETLRGTVAAEALRVSFLASTHDYYFALVDILMRQGKTVEAWQTAERGRAQALLESITGGTRSLNEQKLVQELNAAATKLMRDSPDAEASRKHVELVAQELTRLRAQDAALESTPVPELIEVQRMLGPDTALVEYAFAESAGYAWIISAQSMASFSLAGSSAIRARSNRVAALINAGRSDLAGGSEFRRAAEDLSQVLMIPALTANVRVRRLVIVPDGPAELVPFESLPAPPTPALIEKYELVESPSAAVALALGRRRQLRSPTVPLRTAVIADSVFDSGDVRLGARVSVSQRSPRFSRLAFSRREAQAIASLGAPGAVVTFLDFDASKDLFTAGRLDGYRVIHISTHGLAGEDGTARSGLVFSLVDRAGSPRDGILSVGDILNLHLNADIVVLSACNSALGTQFAGEGTLSLARAFLHSGANLVLASRWRIDDEAAAALLTTFYRSMWQDGLAPPAALRRAQRSLGRDRRWRSPFYWASFVLLGEP